MNKQRLNQMLFDFGASVYDLLTTQGVWLSQARELFDWSSEMPETASRALDLGCGPGMSTIASAMVLSGRLAGRADGSSGVSVTGLDRSEKMIALANRRARDIALPDPCSLSFVCADAAQVPFDDGEFDLLSGHSFVYLLPEPERVLEEAFRLLKPGGVLLLCEPDSEGNLFRAAPAALQSSREALASVSQSVRFGASLVGWRLAVRAAGGMTPTRLRALIESAGFVRIRTRATLGGLATHLEAVRPQT
ncbi:MAG: methyltransferase domain-containing protein [Myxococcales bacterium]|nr:methyltransferase domain-containing protein [Myxococcales bacterium]